MAYKLSERKKQDRLRGKGGKHRDPNRVDLGAIATVFMLFGLLSLITAWVFSFDAEKVVNTSFRGAEKEIGPIHVKKFNEVYNIDVESALKTNTWSFVGGEVLDSNKQYLFSFGQEFWDEVGYDSDGKWHESDTRYDMSVTFPKPGKYYIKMGESERSGATENTVKVKVSKKLGSAIPHFWLGVVLLVIGIIINEVKNRTIGKVLAED